MTEVGRWHWGLIGNAKETLERLESMPDVYWYWHPDPPPEGLDLFGKTLPVMGIILPLIVVGLLWILLPRRPCRRPTPAVTRLPPSCPGASGARAALP